MERYRWLFIAFAFGLPVGLVLAQLYIARSRLRRSSVPVAGSAPELPPSPRPCLTQDELRDLLERNPDMHEDLGDLLGATFTPEQLHQIVQARQAARDVIEHLEPHHVHSLVDLTLKIEQQLESIRRFQRVMAWNP